MALYTASNLPKDHDLYNAIKGGRIKDAEEVVKSLQVYDPAKLVKSLCYVPLGNRGNIFHVMAEGGYSEVFDYLLKIIKTLPTTDKDSVTALVNNENATHQTALQIATERGHYLSASNLVELGANPAKATSTFESPIEIAVRIHDMDCFALYEQALAQLSSQRGDISPHRHPKHFTNGQGQKLSHIAAICGNLDVIKQLVSTHGISVDEVDRNGYTPIYHVAVNAQTPVITNGHHDVFKYLLEQSPKLAGFGSRKRTIFHVLASYDQVELLDVLITHFERKNNIKDIIVGMTTTDSSGRTPLHLAAAKGNIRVVQRLLDLEKQYKLTDAEKPSHKPDTMRRTPIVAAGMMRDAAKEQTEIDVTAFNSVIDLLGGEDELQRQKPIVDGSDFEFRVGKLCLTLHSDDINAVTKPVVIRHINRYLGIRMNPPLSTDNIITSAERFVAALRENTPGDSNPLLPLIRHLKTEMQGDYPAILEVPKLQPDKALYHFVDRGNEQEVKWLLTAPNALALLNYRPDEAPRQTPLLLAAEKGFPEIVEAIMGRIRQIDSDEVRMKIINAEDAHHLTPLHYVAHDNFLRSARAIVGGGGNPLTGATDQSIAATPLAIAIEVGNPSMVTLYCNRLRASNAAFTIEPYIHHAALYGNTQALKTLSGGDYTLFLQPDSHGITPISKATSNGKYESLSYMLSCIPEGERRKAHRGDIIGRTPLHSAASNNRVTCLELLLAHDADKDIQDDAGRTPLYMAAIKGQKEAVARLIKERADPHLGTNFDRNMVKAVAEKQEKVSQAGYLLLSTKGKRRQRRRLTHVATMLTAYIEDVARVYDRQHQAKINTTEIVRIVANVASTTCSIVAPAVTAYTPTTSSATNWVSMGFYAAQTLASSVAIQIEVDASNRKNAGTREILTNRHKETDYYPTVMWGSQRSSYYPAINLAGHAALLSGAWVARAAVVATSQEDNARIAQGNAVISGLVSMGSLVLSTVLKYQLKREDEHLQEVGKEMHRRLIGRAKRGIQGDVKGLPPEQEPQAPTPWYAPIGDMARRTWGYISCRRRKPEGQDNSTSPLLAAAPSKAASPEDTASPSTAAAGVGDIGGDGLRVRSASAVQRQRSGGATAPRSPEAGAAGIPEGMRGEIGGQAREENEKRYNPGAEQKPSAITVAAHAPQRSSSRQQQLV